MEGPAQLTLEQQFSLRNFASQVEKMSHAQAQQFCKNLYEQMLLKDDLYRRLIKKDWGISQPWHPPIGELE